MSEPRDETVAQKVNQTSPSEPVEPEHDPAAEEGRESRESQENRENVPGATRSWPDSGPESERAGLSRRGWTVLLSGLLVLALGLTGAFVHVPYVALGPGPTYDVLGQVGGEPVVRIDGQQTYPTSGELRMTTVSLKDGVSLFGALGLWASGRYALAPREEYFKPGQTDEEVKQENAQQFQDSQSNAEVAALRHLGFPVKVLVKEVVAQSAADGKLVPGDRLLRLNDKEITSQEDVRSALANTRPGQTVPVTYQREGQAERADSLTLGQQPDRAEGFLGVQPIDRADVPFDVDIKLEDVGGPSAGLMFALGIVDRLTPGEMVSGEDIAGTGEISEKGQVGPIGGISFKVVAAREAGATTFLTPANNCAEAVAAAPDGLNLIKVGTLDEALNAIAELKAGRPTPKC